MPPSTPPTPKSQFDFIMQNGQPAKKASKIPLPNLPKPVLIVIALIVLFILYSLISSSLSKRNQPDWSAFTSTLARGQEISRVSQEVEKIPQADTATQNLASTANNVMLGWQGQLTAYLKTQGVSVSSSTLAKDVDKSTDTSMQAAAAGNTIDSAYASYLKSQLASYLSDLSGGNQIAGPKGKALISQDTANIQVILKSSVINGSE